MAESVLNIPDLKDLEEEELWNLIDDNRHAISLGVRPCVLIPYLRQARVLTDLDEDEILTCFSFTNRGMKTSLNRELLKLKDEKCDLYVRYTTSLEEKSATIVRNRDLQLEVQQDILAHDLKEVENRRSELAEEVSRLSEENIRLQQEKEELLEEKDCLALEVEKLTVDCEMYQHRSTLFHSQLEEVQAERDKAYLSRDEAQAQIARSLAEKDVLRGQLMELQARVFAMKACSKQRERREKSRFGDEGICSSNQVEPPCSESLRRRDFPSRSDMEDIYSVSRASAPPFLMRSRPQALRITGRVLNVFFQGEMLLNQIQVIGGNKTGVFVHHVTEGSSAHNTGISPGSQILQLKYEREQRAVRMVLEDTTMEEALWAMGQVQGPCHITLRPSQDAYENLLQQLKNGEVMSGDSFYIRVNMTMPGDVAGTLAVKCNDILHVTDTHHSNDGSWWASHVHPCHLEDLKSGVLPNYYRAQRLLIRALEDMTYPRKTQRKGTHCVLPLGLDCVRRLHRAEIFPIIIYIMSTERSLRRLRQKLRQNVLTESQVLECSCSEEPLLDKLPCLYQSIPPESWHDSTTLIDTLKTVVAEEQQKIVWVESDTW
ncbi:caspase recruitment domain-containing 14 [Labeo rohita]|uniref:Caspase recruitment domain-containing 14 n=1 Tax=Labeo rohita TaxID=84645 RepID=A0A498M4V4_LABRO|nr:caspase recruitment domain-containing 14 [Labeo rohita]RXN36784.1 caspase recruitment domain-containing 14 [Labeo rohita]